MQGGTQMIDHRFTRRQVLHLGGLAGASALLAACAPTIVKETVVVQQTVVVEKPKEVEKVITSTPKPQEKVVLEQWDWASDANDTNLAAIKASVQVFQERNPLITVNLVHTPMANQTLQKLMAAIAGNTAPDVAHVDLFTVVSWAARLSFEDMTPLAEADGVDPKKEFYEWAVKEGSYKNRLYALPSMESHSVFYWNKAHFREAGFDPDKPPKSAEEMWKYCDKLDQKSGGRYSRIGYDPLSGVLEWPISFFWAGCSKGAPADFNPFYNYSQQKCTVNDPKIVEALKWKIEWVKRYGIGELEGFRSSFGWAEQDPLGTGLVSMEIGGTWLHNMLRQYFPNLEWAVGPMPVPEKYGGTSDSACMGPEGYAIPRGALARGHLQQAWQLVRWITGAEGDLILLKATDNVSPRLDLISDPWFKRSKEMEYYVSQLPCGWNRPTIPEGNMVWTDSIAAEDKAVHDQGDPQQLLDEVAQRVDEAMKQWQG
jgi:multiple sugar transport system substrate-binding protein